MRSATLPPIGRTSEPAKTQPAVKKPAVLASSLGYSKQLTGSYQAGFLIFASLAIFALIGLTGVKTRWRTTWGASHLTTAKI